MKCEGKLQYCAISSGVEFLWLLMNVSVWVDAYQEQAVDTTVSRNCFRCILLSSTFLDILTITTLQQFQKAYSVISKISEHCKYDKDVHKAVSLCYII